MSVAKAFSNCFFSRFCPNELPLKSYHCHGTAVIIGEINMLHYPKVTYGGRLALRIVCIWDCWEYGVTGTNGIVWSERASAGGWQTCGSQICPPYMTTFALLSLISNSHPFDFLTPPPTQKQCKNIARVRNCPDVTVLNSFFLSLSSVFLSFCLFSCLVFF